MKKEKNKNVPSNRVVRKQKGRIDLSSSLLNGNTRRYIAILFLLLIFISIPMLLHYSKPQEQEKERFIFYYPVDYDEDIFTNKAYMLMDRDLFFGDSRVQQKYVYDTDYEKADTTCKFFLDYFKCAIEGRYEDYKSFFVSDYFDGMDDPMFTMQMLYDIDVCLHDKSSVEYQGDEYELLNFRVDYRIFRNNGTFRYGVPSNTLDLQIYQLIQLDEDTYKIYRILEVYDEE